MAEQEGGREPQEGVLWRELALRLLSGEEPVGPGEEPRLFAGEVPEDVAAEVPVPEGLTVVGGMVRSEAWRGEPETQVVLDAPVGAEEVLGAYRELLGPRGWTEQVWPHEEGGFAFRPLLERAVFCRSRRGPALIVGAHARDGAPTDVKVVLIPAGRDTPCAPEERGPYPERHSVIPTLLPPPAAREYLGGMGGSYGPDSAESTATLRTDLAPEEVAAHYAAQLEGAGWRRGDEGSGGPLAWSTWETADEEGEVWAGVFSAVRLPGFEGFYELRVSARRRGG